MCRDPLRCIVPPHVLTYLVEHGKDTERARELKTLTTDFDARAARIQNAKQRAMGPLEGADVLATIDPPGPNRIIRNADHHWSVTLVRVSGFESLLRHRGSQRLLEGPPARSPGRRGAPAGRVSRGRRGAARTGSALLARARPERVPM
jgi:hypothetical protein